MKFIIALVTVQTVLALGALMVIVNQPKREYIEQYNGLGSGVLKHGTLIQGDYKDPSSIVGHIDRAGTWVIREK